MSKFLNFIEIGKAEGKKIYSVRNSFDNEISQIKWYSPKKEYFLYIPYQNVIIFDSNSLKEMAEFIEKLMKNYKTNGVK
jgi:hypothetical protein